MGQGRLEQLGLKAQEKAIELKVQGLSNQAIADELNMLFGGELSSTDVGRFLQRNSNKTFQIIKADKKYQEQLVKKYFDTIEQMNELNQEMREFFYELRNDPEYTNKTVFCPKCNHKFHIRLKDFGTLLKTAEHLLNQIKHVDTVLGRMQNRGLTIQYNYVDLSKKLTQIMPQLLQKAERMGIAKINKRNLKKILDT